MTKTLKVVSINLMLSRAYLIEVEGSLILVDAGMPGEERRILDKIDAQAGGRLDLIFITHAHLDHYGSAAAIREQTGAMIAIHRLDGQPLADGETKLGEARGPGRLIKGIFPIIQKIWPAPPTPADILLEDGDPLPETGGETTLLHLPGHTLGSSALLVEEAAFVGDLVTTSGRRPHKQRYFAEDWSLLDKSLQRLSRRGPGRTYTGHGSRTVHGSDLNRIALEAEKN